MDIEFNEETAFSRFASLVVFLLVIPVLVFYLGVQFQKTVEFLENYSDYVVTFEYTPDGNIYGQGVASTTPKNNSEEPVFCTMDAKLCPDGSYVGRQGPKCEFAACPTSKK